MLARTFRALATVVAATVTVGAVGTTAVQAKPTKPGSFTITTAQATPAAQPGTYSFSSTWTAAASATKYKVALTKDGVTLASGTVTTLSWNPAAAVKATPGTGRLSVTPLATHFKGATVTSDVSFADIAAPSGAFTTVWDNPTKVATLTETSLVDDSPISQLSRSVDWGDGTVVPWPTGGAGFPNDSLNHTYTTVDRFEPKVTLTDAASHQTIVTVPAVVIDDVTAPSGSFTVSPATAWATLTKVTVTQTALSDDKSPVTNVLRFIDWGDGTAPEAWATGTGFPNDSLQHTYSLPGTFHVTETLTDEAHNPFTTPVLPASDVTVNADTVAPVTKLLLPRAKHSVKAWTTLRGKTTDPAGTGVRAVRLRAVEKRGTSWYAYKATTRTWVKAATKGRAFAKSGVLAVRPNSRHLWAGKLVGLRRGTLVYRVSATDNVGNTSATITHSAKLTLR